MSARRILITGVSNFWGVRLARRLLEDERVERIVGVDTREPPQGLAERITFVEADVRSRDLGSILELAGVDTVVHNDVLQFPEPGRSARQLHDVNVVGTLQLLAACGSARGLRAFVLRGSASIYGSEPGAPAFLTEDMAGAGKGRFPLRTRWQRDLGELERLLEAFARRTPTVTCSILRFQPVLGATLDTPVTRLFRSPVVPTYWGFDPRVQILHEDDSIGALHAATITPMRGAINVAAPGAVSLTRMLRKLGRTSLPIVSPLFGPVTTAMTKAAGLPPLTEDILRFLQYGRCVDITRLRAAGYEPRYSTAEAIEAVAAQVETLSEVAAA